MAGEENVRLTGAQLAEQERRRLDEVSGRIGSFQNFRTELRAAKDALEALGKGKKGDKILVSLGAGVYVRASVDDTGKAVSALTGNVFMNKSGKEIIGVLEKKIRNMDKTIEQAFEEQQKAISRLNQLEQIIYAGQKAMQQRQQKN